MDPNIAYDDNVPKLIDTLKNKKGFSTEKIVVKLTQGETYEDTKKYAKAYALCLGITELEFLRMARPLRKRY